MNPDKPDIPAPLLDIDIQNGGIHDSTKTVRIAEETVDLLGQLAEGKSMWFDPDGNPVTWDTAKAYYTAGYDRRVKLDKLPGGYSVSTVFLSLDHSYGVGQRPLIYETMVFPPGSYADQDMDRYSTREEAIAGHEAMVKKWTELIQNGGVPPAG